MGLAAFNRMRQLEAMKPENIAKEEAKPEVIEQPVVVEEPIVEEPKEEIKVEEQPVEEANEEIKPATPRRRTRK